MKFLVHSTSTASIEDKTADKADKADKAVTAAVHKVHIP